MFGSRTKTSRRRRKIVSSKDHLSSALLGFIAHESINCHSILFVKPKDSNHLSQEVIDRIKSTIRTALSTRHIPAKIIPLSKLPYTTNGKRLEVPTKKLINGTKWEMLNLSSAEDPECLKVFVDHPELRLSPAEGIKAKL